MLGVNLVDTETKVIANRATDRITDGVHVAREINDTASKAVATFGIATQSLPAMVQAVESIALHAGIVAPNAPLAIRVGTDLFDADLACG